MIPYTPRPAPYQANYDSFERTGSDFGSKRRRDGEDGISSDEDLPILGDSHSSPILSHQSRISHSQPSLSASASAFSTVARSQYGTTKRPRLQAPESSPGYSPSAPSRRPRMASRASPASSTRRERRPLQLLALEHGRVVQPMRTSTPAIRDVYQQVASGSSSPFHTPSPPPSRARTQSEAGPSGGSASPRNQWDRSLSTEYPFCSAHQPPSGNTPAKHPFIFTPKRVASPARSGILTPDPSQPMSVYGEDTFQDPREELWYSPPIN